MAEIFFIDSYVDFHTNGTNRAYWAKIFRRIAERLNETNKPKLFSSFNEDMPIYEFYSITKQKSVRVMQYNPHNAMIKEEIYPTERLFTAWTDDRMLSENLSVPELVVCLLMTKPNVEKAEKLINAWLFEDDEKTESLIEKVYEAQDKMDGNIAR